MRIAIIAAAAGLALAGGLGATAPADAQRYDGYRHHDGYRDGNRDGYRGGYGDRGYRGGHGYRHGGYGYRDGYRRGRLVCTYRYGHRQCFRR